MKLTFVLGVFISVSTFGASFSASLQLQDHWRTWFNWLDTDKNGYLTFKDAEIIAVVCEHHSPLTPADCNKVSQARMYIFQFSFLNTLDNVDSNEFVATLTEMLDTDPQTFHDKTKSVISSWLDSLDVNDDLQISFNEYAMDIKMAGYQVENFFAALNPVNNLIGLQTAINAWLEYLLEDDKNSGILASAIVSDNTYPY